MQTGKGKGKGKGGGKKGLIRRLYFASGSMIAMALLKTLGGDNLWK